MIELPSGYGFGKSLARPERGGAEFQDAWSLTLCLSKSPSRMYPGSPSVQRTQTLQMRPPPCSVTPVAGLSRASVVPPPPAWGPEELPVVTYTGTELFPLSLSCSPGSAPASPASLPLARLIRSSGVPMREGSCKAVEEVRGLEFSRRRKDKHLFFSTFLSLHHIN